MLTLHPFRQRTVKTRVTLEGVGLHSGAKVNLTLAPAPADHGVVFVRTDLSPSVEIPARVSAVVDTRLNTCLGVGAVRVGTVEHVMAALAGCGIDNVRVEVTGPEVPIADGSCAEFVRLIERAGVREQPALRRYLAVRRGVTINEGGKFARLEPSRRFSIRYTIDFQHPLITDQSYEVELTERSFQREIARARTFGFKRDIDSLYRAGLAKGGSLDNAVVVDDYRILNPDGLRFPDEFVRHKILDAIGDLALAGLPILGRFTAIKSGHALNHALLTRLLADEAAWEIVQPHEESELEQLEELPSFANVELA